MRALACNLNPEELPDLIKNSSLVMPAVVTQIITLLGFDVIWYAPRGATPEARDVSFIEQFEISMGGLLIVRGNVVHAAGGVERLATLGGAVCKERTNICPNTAPQYHQAIQLLASRRRIATLVNEDLGGLTFHLFDAAFEAGYR